jgi:GxxExxY protein
MNEVLRSNSGPESLENDLARIVVNCALKVHKALGPGLLESAYEECLYYELSMTGLTVEKQKPLPLLYEKVQMDVGYRVDLLVDNRVIIKIKAVEAINDVHVAQLLTYLKLSGCRLGLLINFNVALIKDGIRRVVNKLQSLRPLRLLCVFAVRFLEKSHAYKTVVFQISRHRQ